jgi:hypothetical protein
VKKQNKTKQKKPPNLWHSGAWFLACLFSQYLISDFRVMKTDETNKGKRFARGGSMGRRQQSPLSQGKSDSLICGRGTGGHGTSGRRGEVGLLSISPLPLVVPSLGSYLTASDGRPGWGQFTYSPCQGYLSTKLNPPPRPRGLAWEAPFPSGQLLGFQT